LFSFDSLTRRESYLVALQAGDQQARHSAHGSTVEGLSDPVQVVWRQAALALEEVELDPAGGDVAEQVVRAFQPAAVPD